MSSNLLLSASFAPHVTQTAPRPSSNLSKDVSSNPSKDVSSSSSRVVPPGGSTIAGLDGAIVVAMSKMFDHDRLQDVFTCAREATPAGKYNFDASLRVRGAMNIGEDYTSVIAARMPWEALALLALSRLNTATQAIVMQEVGALVAGDQSLDETLIDVKARAVKAVNATKAKLTQSCKGKVTLLDASVTVLAP